MATTAIITQPSDAPLGAGYIVVASNSTLTDERVLTGTTNRITLSDGGPGGSIILSTPQDIHTGATPQFAGASLIGGQTTIQPTANSYNSRIAFVRDEPTTNLITNPSIETNTTGYSAYSGTTLTRSSSQAYMGTYSLRVQGTGASGQGVELAAITVTPNTSYIFSFYVYSASAPAEDYNPSTTRESIIPQINLNVSGTTSGQVHIAVRNEWVRCWQEVQAGASDTSLTLRILTNTTITADWYIDCLMFEQKNITSSTSQYGWPTTYCDGAMGAGHSWSGTAHASTSSRAAGDHWLAPLSANSQNGFSYKTDGTMASSRLQYISERAPAAGSGLYSSGGDSTTVFIYDFISRQATSTGLGGAEGTMRVYNKDNGVALWIKSNTFTNSGFDEAVIIVEGPNIRNGSILSVAAPTDLTNFTGYYMRFFDKSNRDMFTVKRNTLNFGNEALAYPKAFRLTSSGAYSETLGSNLTGTIATTASSTTLTGTGTSFTTELVVGDVIKLSGISSTFVVQAIASNTSLTVTSAPSSSTTGNTFAKYASQYGTLCLSMTDPTGDHKGIAKAGPWSCLFPTRSDLLRYSPTSFTTGSGTLTMTAASGNVTTSVANAGIAVGDWIHAPGQTARAAGQAPMQVIKVNSTTSFQVRPAATASWTTASGNWSYQKTGQETMPSGDSTGVSIHKTLFFEASDAGPSASTTETSLFTTLPVIRAYTMTTNRPVNVTIYGDLSGANAAKALTLRVKLGSTTILTTHAEVIADVSTNNFRLDVLIAPNASETSQRTSLTFNCQSPTTSAVDTIIDYETSSVDCTADQALDITAQWGVAASTLTARTKIVRAE